ncbi:MAG: hypothetical protein ACRBCT_06690 [Alphaproteobacteria bacterium]
MKKTVFIHTNKKQYLGALVAKYMLQKYTKDANAFDVKIISLEDYPALHTRDKQKYLRSGRQAIWNNNDLQSFTLLRFLPPELMDYKGRSIVIDPDIFALADINTLFNKDMENNTLMCRLDDKGNFSSSVMLMDNEKLKHWRWEEDINDLFNKKRDYRDWMSLNLENPETIGIFEKEWNSFDELNENTKMLHNTKRLTQPWRTGLPITFDRSEKIPAKTWKDLIPFKNTIKKALGRPIAAAKTNPNEKHSHHQPHPDQTQIDLFFTHLTEAIDAGIVTESHIQDALATNEIREDIHEIVASYKSKAA